MKAIKYRNCSFRIVGYSSYAKFIFLFMGNKRWRGMLIKRIKNKFFFGGGMGMREALFYMDIQRELLRKYPRWLLAFGPTGGGLSIL